MKRTLQIFAFLVIPLFLTGCFEIFTKVKINMDGSGTITESMTMSEESFNRIKALSPNNDPEESSESPSGFSLMDVAKLEAKAAEMGEGVKLASTREVKEDGRLGYVATYSFPDIRKVVLSPNSGDKMNPNASDSASSKNPYRFRMEKSEGGTLLTILSPVPEKEETTASDTTIEDVSQGDKTDADDEAMTDSIVNGGEDQSMEDQSELQAMQMMRLFFAGMRINLTVEVNGKVMESNAAHRSGNLITLLDLDMDKLLADEQAFLKFSKMNPESESDKIESLKGMPGVKMDLSPEIRILISK